MPLRAAIAALVLAVASGEAFAADNVGYSEAFDTLYRVDLTTHTAQQVGPAGFLNGQQRIAYIEGLSLSPSGALFAVSDALKDLIQIDPTTGLATVVGALNLSNESTTQALDLGMTFSCDGRLWLSAGDGNFWQVDPTNGATTLVGNTGVKITGLASAGGAIFGAGSQGDNNLYRIDPSTAHVSLVGAYGSGASYITTTSPAFDASGHLWAVLGYVPPQPGVTTIPEWSDLAAINPSTGVLTDTGNIVGDANLRDNLAGNLKGLAIASPCTAIAGAGGSTISSLPATSWQSLALLMVMIGGIAAFRFSRRYPTV